MQIRGSAKSVAAIHRRQFLAGAAGLAGAALLPGRFALAQAAPHSFRHGDFEVLVISDGRLTLPLALHAFDAPKEERDPVLAAAGMTGETTNPAVNLTLLRRGGEAILFDVGGGPNMSPEVGKVAESLAAAGLDPAAVTKIVISHAHPDHIFGLLTKDGALAFPNATYFAGGTEWDFWTAEDLLSKFPESMHQMGRGIQAHLAAVKEKLTVVKPGDDIVTGVRGVDTKGHTPGHLSFEVDGGDGLIIVADAIPHNHIYFARPDFKFQFDAIHEQAIATRKALLDRAASDRTLLLGYHWAYPGLGFAERKDGNYVFVAG